MKGILLSILMIIGLAAAAQITAISPVQDYVGDSLQTTITSSALFLTGSSPQGNIQNIIFKNATDSVFAVSDSTNVVTTSTATTFWRIPSTIATGVYNLIVRIYNNLFSGPTTDYTLTSAFNITTPVWPGDADNNKVVDNNDLLPIGLGFGTTGNARLSTSTTWQAWSSIGWIDSFTSYTPVLNYKYADCDGNGTINAADTLAIIQNFSLTHNKTNPLTEWRSGSPAIIPVFSSDTLYNGDTVQVSFVFGDAALPANNIYGIAFTYNFDPLIMDSAGTEISLGGSWFGTSANRISIGKTMNGQGEMKLALTRIDHHTSSGHGSLGYATFKITTDNISGIVQGPHYINLGYISDVNVIDSTGNPIPVNGGTDSTVVSTYPQGIAGIAGHYLKLMPNPAETKVMISADQNINEITITDINGQQVLKNTGISAGSVNIDIADYVDGLYFVQVKTAKGVMTEKLLITK